MATTDDPRHPWPEDEPTVVRATPKKRGRLARIGRVFGDTALTMGMSKGMTGDNTTVSSESSITNILLFSEGTKKGLEADPPDGG